MKLTIKILSLKTLIRKIFRATIIVRVETVSEKKKKREVVDLTGEPDSTPTPSMSMPSPAIIRARGAVDAQPNQRDAEAAHRAPSAAPSWTMTPETVGREATPASSTVGSSSAELPRQPATPKGKEPVQYPALPTAQFNSRRESSAGPSGAPAPTPTLIADTSSSPVGKQEPSTPPRNIYATAAGGNLSPRKRGQESPDIVVVKEEPVLGGFGFGVGFGGVIIDDRPATPVKKEESSSSSGDEADEDEDDDDDVIQISPFKKRRGSMSPDLFSIPALPAAFQRSPSPSPTSSHANAAANAAHADPIPGTPFRHPDFPSRPPLRCPKKNPAHTTIESEVSTSSRNARRRYYRCRDCPGFGGFVCWADRRGVRPDNPLCWCRQPAREDITGDGATQPDTLWYKCATDHCKFRRFDWDDPLSPEEVNRYCGRQVYPL
ncbi:retromer complex subunit Vps35 [Hypoxylon texense]